MRKRHTNIPIKEGNVDDDTPKGADNSVGRKEPANGLTMRDDLINNHIRGECLAQSHAGRESFPINPTGGGDEDSRGREEIEKDNVEEERSKENMLSEQKEERIKNESNNTASMDSAYGAENKTFYLDEVSWTDK